MKALLNHIELALEEHHRTPYQFMSDAVKDRLNLSLKTYEEELESGANYVATKSELNVIKKL